MPRQKVTQPRQAHAEQASTFLPLSPQAFQVLLSLHGEPRHGYAIIQEIAERSRGDMRLTASTLYDALARMVDQGFIQPADAPAAETDSRRRYYRITALGRAVVDAEAKRLVRLVDMARAKVPSLRG